MFVYTGRSCGLSESGKELFSTLMNLPRPVRKVGHEKLVKKITTVCKTVAEASM